MDRVMIDPTYIIYSIMLIKTVLQNQILFILFYCDNQIEIKLKNINKN